MKQNLLIAILGNPIRIQILCQLQNNARNVQELMHNCKLSQSAVSQHLAKLRSGRLVRVDRVGKFRYYSLVDPKYGQLARLIQEFGEKL